MTQNISLIKLFGAVLVKNKTQKNPSKSLLERTLKKGYIFAPEVVNSYTVKDLDTIANLFEDEYSLSEAKMNATLHKSWAKVKNASLRQLYLEQSMHYFTTYGFMAMGVYDDSSIYIPNEAFDIPITDSEKIKLRVIKGYTKKEVQEKVKGLLSSGVALKRETIDMLLSLKGIVKYNDEFLSCVKNKEIKVAIYDELGVLPEHNLEFLRFAVYKATGEMMLVKNRATIDAIKANAQKAEKLFSQYSKTYGLESLAKIFYRFKPLFLAFKIGSTAKTINKIRKLAKTYHEPMKEDYLNTITAKLKNHGEINFSKLESELERVNTFRKVRLAYALNYRLQNAESILYKVRVGKGYATEFTPFSEKAKVKAKKVYNVVVNSIVDDLSETVKDKKVYIPKEFVYALPATEKQFMGNVPVNSYVKTAKNMIFGVHWMGSNIDLDLSMVSLTRKFGWNASYRNKDGSILFSGDITSAPEPDGATEYYFCKKADNDTYILYINNYSYGWNDEFVPYDVIVGEKEMKTASYNYMMSPEEKIVGVKSDIDVRQKTLGVFTSTNNQCRFYFNEGAIGNTIVSSSSNEYSKHLARYFQHMLENTINLNKLIKKAGAKMVTSPKNADIDLSYENLEKDTILNLLSGKK